MKIMTAKDIRGNRI